MHRHAEGRPYKKSGAARVGGSLVEIFDLEGI
jgi:hypothetical protein